MGRPREHDDGTRLRLLDAAEFVIGTGGLDAVSVRAVALGAGTSVRAVYSLFRSKDGLIEGLAQRAFELLMERVDSVSVTSDPAVDLAQAALEGFRPFALEHPDLFRLAFVSAGTRLGPGVGAAREAAFSRLIARIERAQAFGALPTRPPADLACEFHALCHGLASLELAGVMSGTRAQRLWSQCFGDLIAGWQCQTRKQGGG